MKLHSHNKVEMYEVLKLAIFFIKFLKVHMYKIYCSRISNLIRLHLSRREKRNKNYRDHCAVKVDQNNL